MMHENPIPAATCASEPESQPGPGENRNFPNEPSPIFGHSLPDNWPALNPGPLDAAGNPSPAFLDFMEDRWRTALLEIHQFPEAYRHIQAALTEQGIPIPDDPATLPGLSNRTMIR